MIKNAPKVESTDTEIIVTMRQSIINLRQDGEISVLASLRNWPV
jgi:hypothetical protein